MPSQDEVTEFQNLTAILAEIAAKSAAALWQEEAEELAELYPATVDPHINAAAMIAAEWYDSLAPQAAFAVQPAPPPTLETLLYKADWATHQPDPQRALMDCTDRLVFDASRDTIVDNAEREGVRYARHASANACPWCSVLATRGETYHSAETAKKSHDNCHCVVVPVREDDYFDEPPYVEQWRKEYDAGREEVDKLGDKQNLDNIVNAMRRARYIPASP